MIRIKDIKIREDLLEEKVLEKALQKNRLQKEDVKKWYIYKKSIDARKKEDIFYNYTIDIELKDNNKEKRFEKIEEYKMPEIKVKRTSKIQPVIIGAGPAGLFSALIFVENGIKPILIERGKRVEDRVKDVEEFINNRKFNPKSNIQFGEGGAGTFSDGKLNTGNSSIYSRKVLEEFVKFGAPKEIMYVAKPHLGTDNLVKIVKNIREYILQQGGQIFFDEEVIDFEIEKNQIKSVITPRRKIETDNVILAIGHSARDTFSMLLKQKIVMEPKPFAIGMRVEHPQELIDQIQYHRKEGRGKYLPAAEYSFVTQANNRGVYSFCMCPGGFVVPAASGPKQVVVNGMSPSNRGSRWSNSGMVVEIRPEDYSELVGQEELYLRNGEKVDADSPLALMAFQERLEEVCWLNGGMKQTAPAQRMDDFMRKKNSFDLPVSSYTPGLLASPLHFWMPEFVTSRLREGFRYFGKVSRGFLTNEATMIGVETRTSAPVRILRDRDTYQHVTVKGLFPCGEGAGYAGGIVSAAIDGERCAEGVYNLESNK